MRNFQRFKVIQLLVSVIAAAGSMSYLFFSGVISQGLLSQPAILILSLLVWLLSLLSFIYILVDARLLRNMTAEYAGRFVAKYALKTSSRPLVAMGLAYKGAAALGKLLPRRTSNWIVGKMYAK